MPAENAQGTTLIDVPRSYRAIIATRYEKASIGAEVNLSNGRRMTMKEHHFLAGFYVRQGDQSLRVARRDENSVGADRE